MNSFGKYSTWIVIACSLLMLGIGCSKKKKPAGPLPTADLIFITDPEGATIYWDGEELPQKTPYKLEEVEQGPHTLRLVLEGYAPIVEDYNLSSGGTKLVERKFKTTGILVIESIPSGATVWMENQNRGTTPLTITDLLEGDWVITLRLEDHLTRTDTVEVIGAQTVTVEFPLIKPPKLFKILFYAYNTETKVQSEEPATSFTQRDFINTKAEQKWDRVRFVATFADPVEGDFFIGAELYHEVEKFFTYYIEVKEGDQTLIYDIANTDPPGEKGDPGYSMEKGNYKIRFVAGGIVIGEGTFEVK